MCIYFIYFLIQIATFWTTGVYIYIYIYIYLYLYHKKFEHNARCHWLKAKLKLSRRLPTMSDLFRDLSLAFFVN